MATDQYRRWVAAGRPYRLATWLVDVKALARRHGVTWLGDLGNLAHLTADYPEDHTPFSFTEWPTQISEYVVNAGDMDDGPWSDRILADARAGGLPWLKYLNFRGRSYSRRRDGFATSRPSSDRHLHLSGMSTHTWIGLGGYDPFGPPAAPQPSQGEDTDMRGILGRLHDKSTVWYGTTHHGETRALGREGALTALQLAGAVQIVFTREMGYADAMAGALGWIPGDTTGAATVAEMLRAG